MGRVLTLSHHRRNESQRQCLDLKPPVRRWRTAARVNSGQSQPTGRPDLKTYWLAALTPIAPSAGADADETRTEQKHARRLWHSSSTDRDVVESAVCSRI